MNELGKFGLEGKNLFSKIIVILVVFVVFLTSFMLVLSKYSGMTGFAIQKNKIERGDVIEACKKIPEVKNFLENNENIGIEVSNSIRDGEKIWEVIYSSGNFNLVLTLSEELKILKSERFMRKIAD